MKIKSLLAAATLALSTLSIQAFAVSTSVGFNPYAGPMQYEKSTFFGCTWTFYSSSGGQIGSSSIGQPSSYWVAFYYKPIGSCQYSTLTISSSQNPMYPSYSALAQAN
jgi:hypothetical protein